MENATENPLDNSTSTGQVTSRWKIPLTSEITLEHASGNPLEHATKNPREQGDAPEKGPLEDLGRRILADEFNSSDSTIDRHLSNFNTCQYAIFIFIAGQGRSAANPHTKNLDFRGADSRIAYIPCQYATFSKGGWGCSRRAVADGCVNHARTVTHSYMHLNMDECMYVSHGGNGRLD